MLDCQLSTNQVMISFMTKVIVRPCSCHGSIHIYFISFSFRAKFAFSRQCLGHETIYCALQIFCLLCTKGDVASRTTSDLTGSAVLAPLQLSFK